MISTNDTVDELITAGYLQKSNRELARSILKQYQKTAVDAVSAKRFALEDKAYQAKVVHDAQELAETDLEMDQIEDRFIQAEVIDQAASLSAKDDDYLMRCLRRLMPCL